VNSQTKAPAQYVLLAGAKVSHLTEWGANLTRLIQPQRPAI